MPCPCVQAEDAAECGECIAQSIRAALGSLTLKSNARVRALPRESEARGARESAGRHLGHLEGERVHDRPAHVGTDKPRCQHALEHALSDCPAVILGFPGGKPVRALRAQDEPAELKGWRPDGRHPGKGGLAGCAPGAEAEVRPPRLRAEGARVRVLLAGLSSLARGALGRPVPGAFLTCALVAQDAQGFRGLCPGWC
jgi:hypothetical protein